MAQGCDVRIARLTFGSGPYSQDIHDRVTAMTCAAQNEFSEFGERLWITDRWIDNFRTDGGLAASKLEWFLGEYLKLCVWRSAHAVKTGHLLNRSG